ncbi:hypothetical protein [Sphingobacterium sp. UDSM-2020]|uniref:hypothetical protein n=1 Tax=Sphingobacterium sp. UDSM-2020 TaxID=2795738 RepID=UPI001937A61F|nr:hypothetical protein [Sphingobacterium sp. UDSM-2020]QQD15530.1 hypothetical protein JAZ75_08460 [Sphingobacterium sp. UDSM-2020]
MKLLYIKKANWVVATVLLATSGLLVSSCSKEKSNVLEHTDEIEGTNLILSVVGTSEDQSSNNIDKKGSVNSNATKMTVKSYSDVDVVSLIDNNVPNLGGSDAITQKNSVSGQKASANNNLRAAALGDGITYRLYLFTADGSQLISSQQFSVGQSTVPKISVTPGQTYKWVALSYNDNTNITDITSANTTLTLPENKDILYATNIITIPSTPNANVPLPITFGHKFARIAIELNSMGVFGNMNSGDISVTGLNLKTASIDVKTGLLTPLTNTFTPTINWNSFTNIDPAFSDAKIAYAYTAGTSALNGINVSASNLTITHSDGINRTFGATTAISIPFNLSPELGKSHRLLANIVESPLTATGSTVKWARSNLYYAAGHNPYRFFAENKLRSEGYSYFAFGSVIPGKFATTATKGDPCSLVYPAGLWKQPTKASFTGMVRGDIELNQLTNVLGGLGTVVDATGTTGLLNLVTNLLGNTIAVLVNTPAPNSTLDPNAPYTYGQYGISSGAPTSGTNAFGDVNNSSNRLRFYYNGQISNINVLQAVGEGDGLLNVGLNDISADLVGVNLINLNIPLLDSYGKSTALWTNQQGTNILSGLAGLGTWAYAGNAGRGISATVIPPSITLGARFHMANNTGELLNGVSALGIDVLSTTFKNVRCIRAL